MTSPYPVEYFKALIMRKLNASIDSPYPLKEMDIAFKR